MDINSAQDRTRSRSEISGGVISALSALVQCAPESLQEDTLIFEELGLDSSVTLELLMELEDVFQIEFDPETLEHDHFRSVGSLIAYVADQANAE